MQLAQRTRALFSELQARQGTCLPRSLKVIQPPIAELPQFLLREFLFLDFHGLGGDPAASRFSSARKCFSALLLLGGLAGEFQIHASRYSRNYAVRHRGDAGLLLRLHDVRGRRWRSQTEIVLPKCFGMKLRGC
jgi:hypothetical protein